MGWPRGAALWKGRTGWCHRHRGKQGIFYVLATRARVRGCNELHFWGEEQSSRGTVLQNLHVYRCVEKDERKPIICHDFWSRSGFKVDA